MKNNNEIQIQFVPIELLEYNTGQIPGIPENPRTREDTKQRNLEKSIEELPEMTIARAALCFPYNGRFVVIGGNRRLEAQRALKRKEVPIIALPEDTPVEKLRRMALLDNESTGQTDWAKLAKDWSKDEIRAWHIETPKGWFNEVPGKKAEEDNYEEPKKLKPRVKPGEIWQLGKHRLMCGDSTNKDDVAKLMNGEKADMVFTDPPYGVDYKGIDNDSRGGFEGLLDKAFFNLKQNCKPGAVFYCFHSDRCADIFHKIYRKYCHFSCMIIWRKNSLVLSQTDYQSIHEPCMYGWFNNGTHQYFGDRKQESVWEEKEESVLGHTTPKPISLIGRAIKNSSIKKQLIIDVFGGSGSTLIACEQLNRRCYMMELTEHYCDVIINRWETLTGRKAVKIG